MKEKWLHWSIKEISPLCYIDEILDNDVGFFVTISDEDTKIQLNFGPVESFRSCDEHSRMKLYYFLDKEYTCDFYKNNGLFKVENSEYIKWLNTSSEGITENMNLVHYVIFDDIRVLDIIAYCEPTIKIIKKRK